MINPAGIVFGPNATVNVSGSFHAATADYLKMSDGSRFQATNSDGRHLELRLRPLRSGSSAHAPGAITVNGSILGVRQGQTLGLVGGAVNVTGATLQAPAGKILVTSVASTGEVPVAPGNGAPTITSLGTANITQSALLNVSDPKGLGSGGGVFVRAGNLTVDNSEINADNYGTGGGGAVLLRGDSDLTLSDGANVHAMAMSSGVGASITLQSAAGGTLLVDNSLVLASSGGPGATGQLDVSGDQVVLTDNGLVVNAATGSGNGGPLNVTAGTLSIANGAALVSEGGGTAQGSNVSINASGLISVVGPFAGIDVFTDPGSAANAGAVAISAANMSIVNGQVSSFTAGSGNSGDMSLNIAGALSITGPLTTPSTFLVGIADRDQSQQHRQRRANQHHGRKPGGDRSRVDLVNHPRRGECRQRGAQYRRSGDDRCDRRAARARDRDFRPRRRRQWRSK